MVAGTQDCNVRQLLADMLSEEGHHAEAARTLARINTSAAGRYVVVPSVQQPACAAGAY